MSLRHLALLTFTTILTAAEPPVSFEKEIQPIFESSCLKCHGAKIQLSQLDLRTREAAQRVLTPGKAEQSRLYRLISGAEKPAMPMDGKLTAGQIETIKRWIDQGAPWSGTEIKDTTSNQLTALEDMKIPPEARQYWAFQKPAHLTPPAGEANPVDAFLMAAMKKAGINPAPRADKATLLRRAYLDLIGLPPTPAQSAEFVRDNSPDAWHKLIDRLLAIAAIRRALGTPLARRCALRRFERIRTRFRSSQRLALSRLRDSMHSTRTHPTNVFLREQIAGDELDWVTKRQPDRHRIPAQLRQSRLPRKGQSRVPLRISRRHDRAPSAAASSG